MSRSWWPYREEPTVWGCSGHWPGGKRPAAAGSGSPISITPSVARSPTPTSDSSANWPIGWASRAGWSGPRPANSAAQGPTGWRRRPGMPATGFSRPLPERLAHVTSSRPTRPTIRSKRSCSGSFAARAWRDWPACGRARPLGPAATLIRPLLELSRQEIRAYLRLIGQDWREDSSNARTDATRNWLRHELLPGLERQFSPGVPAAILRLARLAGQAQALVERLAGELAERAMSSPGSGQLVFRCDALAGQDRAVGARDVRRGLARRGLAGAGNGA